MGQLFLEGSLVLGTLLAVMASRVTLAASDVNAVELVRYQDQVSTVHVAQARLGGQTGLGVFFSGTGDLHYYATGSSTPARGLELQIKASGPGITFGDPVFPQWRSFHDPAQAKDVDVYVGDFQVFLPVLLAPPTNAPADVRVTISGLACTSQVCLPPLSRTLEVAFNPRTSDWATLRFEPAPRPASGVTETPDPPQPAYGMIFYLLAAVLAGVSINGMPCVLPVLPLIILRLVQQSQQGGKARLVSGAAFCGGMVLFFAAFAGVAAMVHAVTGASLDLNSLFRYPTAVISLFLGITLFALVMLDVVTLTLPSFVTNRRASGTSLAGAIGTGFFAAVLSIPCSGAMLGFVLVWAQTQPSAISSLAIILMGVGMALPYAVLILVPGLLNRIPRPGEWMDVFKKSCGFLLLLVAVKLALAALPKERLIDVLLYGVIFSFCAWMWGTWVDYSTAAAKKWTVRLVAVAIAIGTGLWLLPIEASAGPTIAWQDYDAGRVGQAKAQGRPVLLKFTADWCTNCRILDRRVYAHRQVGETIGKKGVLAIKADTTSFDSPATRDFKQVYGEAGNVPVTIVLVPGKPNTVIRGLFDRQRLVDLLGRLPDRDGK